MMTTGAAITEIIEAYYTEAGEGWMTITAVAEVTGLTAEQLDEAFKVIEADFPNFRMEPQPFGHRVGREDIRIMRGGEYCDLIKFY